MVLEKPRILFLEIVIWYVLIYLLYSFLTYFLLLLFSHKFSSVPELDKFELIGIGVINAFHTFRILIFILFFFFIRFILMASGIWMEKKGKKNLIEDLEKVFNHKLFGILFPLFLFLYVGLDILFGGFWTLKLILEVK